RDGRRDGAGPGSSPSLPSLAGVHVLVVDDEREAREAIGALVERCGARVTTVGSAAAALAALDATPPDVILCDIGMPEEDGYVFIRELRARPREHGGAIPAAALTAYARDEDRDRVLSAGFQAHLTKPLEALDLTVAVADLLKPTR